MSTPASSPYPLAGVRVLDLTRLLPGGFCTLILADMGADVVKVEDPHGGDYSRTMPPFTRLTPEGPPVGAVYAALNRGKRSVVVDLKSDEGRRALLDLTAAADVLVEGFRPGVMDRLGVGPATLLARNPRLVYCALTGYGQSGPLAAATGHDLNYIGTVGVLDLNGNPSEAPAIPGVQVADLSGALVATLGIVTALFRRNATGRGGMVDTSMAEAAFALTSLPWSEWAATRQPVQRGSHILSGGWACYNVYRARDERYLALGCLESKFWATFAAAVGHPEWAARQFDPAEQPALRQTVAHLFAQRSSDEWLALAQDHDIPLTLVNRLDEVAADPQLNARGVFFDSAVGLTARTPVRIDDLAPAATTPPPGQGEHSVADVLADWQRREQATRARS
ncbi:MAG: CoA transferase [Anaerolineae bacterium]